MARPEQLPNSDENWSIYLYLAGRGAGKTRTAAEWLAWEATTQNNTRWAIVAPTFGDVRDVCAEGESGIINILRDYGSLADYNRSQGAITLTNGSKIKLFSADEPDRLRGPQHHGAWCFIAGTLIATPNGDVPIERLSIGDEVITSSGVGKVSALGERKTELATVHYGDRTLTGSLDHPIYTQRGWVELSNLRSDDILYLWKDGGDQTKQDTSTATKQEKSYLGTESCGQKPMGKSRWGRKFTTSTTSKVTIGWKTLLRSHPSNTGNTTRKRLNLSPVAIARLLLKPALRLQQLNTANPVGGKLGKASANSSCENVSIAGQPSLRDMVGIAVSGVSILGRVGQVFNLTVEPSHDYFANGVLVHNCDELAAWRYPDTWDQLQFGMRLGSHPRTVITTTPRPVSLIRNLVNRTDGSVKVVRGSTFDNAQNLAPQALLELQARYAGTRMGRQELYGELLTESDSALWTRALIEQARIKPEDAPPYFRVVVAIDPAVTSGESSDETGIVVAGATPDGHYYILEDASMRGTPEKWAQRAVEMYRKWKCDRVIGEANNGGDMIEALLRQVDPSIPYRKVHASRGKKVRAEPISALSEQLRLHMVGSDFALLEDQLVTWEPDSDSSPDRMDAMVWAVTDLMGNSGALRSLAAMADFCPNCRLPLVRGTKVCPRCQTAIIPKDN